MLLASLLLFLVVEGFPSLVVDENDVKESARVTVTHESSSNKSSADLLSDLLLDLREEIEMIASSASTNAMVHKEEILKLQEDLMTKGGQANKSTSDLQKSTYSTKHPTTFAPKERQRNKLTEVKEIGATNVESGTKQGLEGLQRPLTKENEQFPQDESSQNAEHEDCTPERWCHTTFSNEYQTTKDEECKETFAR